MGDILYLECNKNEEHKYEFFVGSGMMFSSEYNKLINQIKKGKYGEEIRKFLIENPKGAINCEREIVQCPKCGKLKEVPNLSMYIAKKNNDNIVASFDIPFELKTKYKKFKDYKHVCSKCSSTMKIVKIKHDDCGCVLEDKNGAVITNIKIKCPKCDGTIKISRGGCWD